MKKLKYIIAVFVLIAGFTSPAFAQKGIINRVISGTVYETATGNPISGAKITIPGVASDISSDSGHYQLKKTVEGAYLVVNAPGYAPKRISVNGRSNINIYLIDASFKGNYEDIALPFGTSNATEYTGSVATHENRTDYQTGATGTEQILKGRLSGLHVLERSGTPGAGANMFLDGINTLNINSQPLIVVDGVIYGNQPIYSLISGNHISALTDIDVKDIDNITVLKDGTSLYGSKAANGVILINTIRAKNPATRINFYAYSGVNLEPNTKYQMMDAASYKNYLVDLATSAGMTANQINALPYINPEKPVTENWGISGNQDYYRYNQSTDWQNQVFTSSLNQNYHLNVTGGNDKTLIAVSVGYLGQNGNVKNTSYNRYSTRVNADIEMSDWFKLEANVSFIYDERSLSFEGLNQNFNPVYAALIKAPFTAPYVYNILGEETPNYEDVDILGVSNPSVLVNNPASNNRFRFFGNLKGHLTFSKYLNADLIFGLTSDKTTKEKIFMPEYGVSHDVLASGIILNEAQELRNTLSLVNTDARLNYNRTFDYIHKVSAHLGFRYQSGYSELDWGKSYNSSSDRMQTLGDGISALAQVGGNLGTWKSISNYLNVDYSYLNRYFLSLNAALDGSSRFGSEAAGLKLFNHVFGLFPSINGAWLATSEDFMKDQQIFDVLKVRAGYSVTGNDDIGNYSSRLYYIPQGFLGAYGLVRGNIPDPTLKWETNRKASLGIDASFLKQKLNVSLDLYSSTTADLINIKPISNVSGFSSIITNDGSMGNQGIDLSINGRVVDSHNFKWDLGLNMSTYKNKLLSSSTDETLTTIDGGIIRTKVGSPVAQFYGYQTDGVFTSAAEASAANLNIKNSDGTLTPFTAGDVRFVDRNGDHIIDSKDMTVIGDPNPKLFGAITTRLQWKQFSLDALFAYSYGNQIYNALRANLESMSGTYNQTVTAVNRWETDGQQTTVPKLVYGDPMGNSRFSDRWIEDGSYIRLKTVTLSYDLNLKSNFINNAQIYVTGNNMLTFTNYLGYDPEFSIGQSPLYAGIDPGVTPQQRTLLLGVKIGL